jgi:hypothetical protein
MADSDLPDWLTPTAILAALNTNKRLRKIGRKLPLRRWQSLGVVNGGLKAATALTGR